MKRPADDRILDLFNRDRRKGTEHRAQFVAPRIIASTTLNALFTRRS